MKTRKRYKKLPSHLTPFFKTMQGEHGTFTLCVLHDSARKRFSAGVSLVHKSDQNKIDWQKGKKYALQRALSGKNHIIKRFPAMTFTDNKGELHFQHIGFNMQYENLTVMKFWQEAQYQLQKFYVEVRNNLKNPTLKNLNTAVKNPKSHLTMEMKPQK